MDRKGRVKSRRILGVGAAAVLATATIGLAAAGLTAESERAVHDSNSSPALALAESPVSFLSHREKSNMPNAAVPIDNGLQEMMVAWCAEYGVPIEVVLGCIETESGFQAAARNGRCYGYMQVSNINLDWLGSEIGVADLTDPTQNIHSGIFILGDLFEKYGDWHKTLVCYNCGEAGAKRDVFAKGETTSRYSKRVMTSADRWKEVVYQ